jgi:hypothetical protein
VNGRLDLGHAAPNATDVCGPQASGNLAEFLRQSATIAAVWAASGNDTASVELPGKDHFTVLDALPDPASAMTVRLKAMAKSGR